MSRERVVCWRNIQAYDEAVHATVFRSRIYPIRWRGEANPTSLYHHVWRQKGRLQRSVFSTTRPVASRVSCQEHNWRLWVSCVADIPNPDSGCWAAWMFVPLDSCCVEKNAGAWAVGCILQKATIHSTSAGDWWHHSSSHLTIFVHSSKRWKQLELHSPLVVSWLENRVFPVASWGVFNRKIRTNNYVEGWHHRFHNMVINLSSLNMYKLIHLLNVMARNVNIQVSFFSKSVLLRHKRKRYKL